jgi:tripartite-type tricarboxylate transporter receptor subunit TctC
MTHTASDVTHSAIAPSRRSLLLGTGAALLASPALAQAWQPARPVEFIVAAGPGGGTDQFARIVQSIIQKHNLMRTPVIVANKGGGAGTEAFVYGRGAAGDPHKVVFGTNNVWLMPLVTRVGYSLADLRPVASMAADEFILWTYTDAPYRTAKDLIDAARAQNGTFRMGGSQARDTDHILTKLIERATGVTFTYVPFRSGGEVAIQLAGKHVDANTNNPAENIAQWRAGRVRPLCVFNPRRLSLPEKVFDGVGWSDIPTSTEAGIGPADFRMPRTVWLPARTTDAQAAFWTQLLARVRETPEWKAWLESGSQGDLWQTGTELASFNQQDEAMNRNHFRDYGWLVEQG